MGRSSTQQTFIVNNFAVIQFETVDGSTKILMIGDHDSRNLVHTVSIYMSTRHVLSVQFFYDVAIVDNLKLMREGVIIE